MSLPIPPRPKASETLVRSILSRVGLPTSEEPVALLGVRGYRRDTMGKVGVNDVRQWDDAMFLVGPGCFKAVPANTDPVRLGWNPGVGKNFAMLCPGLWYFYRGAHKGKKPALRQATEEEAPEYGIPNHGHFKVYRANSMEEVLSGKARVEEGYQAINIHSGGDETTSSWGCQTLPPTAFMNFMLDIWEAMKKASQIRVPYYLVDGPIL
jgi:hypothetical protein